MRKLRMIATSCSIFTVFVVVTQLQLFDRILNVSKRDEVKCSCENNKNPGNPSQLHHQHENLPAKDDFVVAKLDMAQEEGLGSHEETMERIQEENDKAFAKELDHEQEENDKEAVKEIDHSQKEKDMSLVKRSDMEQNDNAVKEKINQPEKQNDKPIVKTLNQAQKRKDNSFVKYANLEEALIDRANDDNVIILSSIDLGYVNLALNLYYTSLKKYNFDNYLFVTSSHKAHEFLYERKIYSVDYLQDDEGEQNSDFSSKAFKRKTHFKTKVVYEALKLGLTVLLVDVDIVFLKNPFPYLNCTECDLQIQSDGHSKNSGFYLARPTKATTDLHRMAWDTANELNFTISNQRVLNRVLGTLKKDNQITVKTLDIYQFPHGRRYFENGRMFAGDNPPNDTVIVHNNFIVSMEGKIFRFKEHLMYEVDAAGYYSNPNAKYLMFENPSDFGPDLTLKYEFAALKTAFALGYLLERIVILPWFHCHGCTRGYCKTEHQRCSFHTYWKVAALDAQFFDQYRESVFLRHKLVPQTVKKSIAYVNIEPKIKSKKYKTYTAKDQKNGATPDEIQEWFGDSKESVLAFRSLYNVFSGLGDEDEDIDVKDKLEKAFLRCSYFQR